MKALWIWINKLGSTSYDLALMEKEYGADFLSWRK